MSTAYFTDYLNYSIVIAPMVVADQIEKDYFRITAEKKDKAFTTVSHRKDVKRKILEMKKFLKAEETAY